jgi:transposase
MRAYSQDLREKILQALEAQAETQGEIAERFLVSLSFVEKLWQRWQTTGRCAAKPHAGGPQRQLRAPGATVRQAVAERPDATLAEVRGYLGHATGVRVRPATPCREVQRLRLPGKRAPPCHGA